MATTDIRFKRVDKEYLSLRETQGELFDKVDGFEGAVLGLNQAVAENRRQIEENGRQIEENGRRIAENGRRIEENREMILENSRKLDALLKHLEVPYKPPTGFVKE